MRLAHTRSVFPKAGSSPERQPWPASGALDVISSLGQPWQSLGPAQVSTAAYGSVTGRVTSVAADPADSSGNTVYVGTTGGGVWRSINAAGPAGQTTFQPLTDNLPAYSAGAVAGLSVGAVSVQPGDTGVILAGTGDPNDALDSYYGSGILRSADHGLTWSLIPESNDFTRNSLSNFYFFGLAFAGFSWSTVNPDVVVAAVSHSAEGDAVNANNVDTAANVAYSVMGLYYSPDAGQTWYLATITDGPGQVIQSAAIIPAQGGNAATAVVWNPVRKRFYAAIRFHGYYESLDGMTWTRLVNQPGTGFNTTVCPTQPNSVGSPACPIFRGALAVQPVTGDLFALTVDLNLLDQGLWQDNCSAGSTGCASNTVDFNRQLPTTSLDDRNGVIDLGDYDLWLAAVPATGDTILFAGTADIFRCSLSAGCPFRNATNISTCAAARVAPFQHAVDTTFAGSQSLMYFGNDSGLWRSTDNVNQNAAVCSSDDANHFQNLNSGLGSLAEVQGIAQDPANSAIVLTGLGINGTAASTTSNQSVWPQVLDGYGSYVAIDPTTPSNWYAQSSAGVAIELCTAGVACTPDTFSTPIIGYVQVGADAYASPEPSPFILDPLTSANILLGTCHLWKGPADGSSWSAANLLGDLYPGEGPDCSGNALIQSLAVAAGAPGSNNETIYAGMAEPALNGPQAYAGHLFQATINELSPTAPTAWTDLWLSPVSNDTKGFNPDDFSISSIATDPHDPSGQTVYVTVEAFDTLVASTATIYVTVNGGTSWTNIRSNLPNAPANSILIDPEDANTIYVALDVGVYITTAVATCPVQNCWTLYGTGLPNAPVVQLTSFHAGGQSLLRAGTYGRGIWQIPLVTSSTITTAGTATPATVSFDPQAVQTISPPQMLTITNTGAAPLGVSRTTASGDFSLVNQCTSPIAPGANCTLQVTFAPTMTGFRNGTATIFSNVNGGQLTANLTGAGLPASAIVLLPAAMNFGSSLIGVSTAPAQNITISNTGTAAATIQAPQLTGDYAIVANTCTGTLAPNFGCTVGLTFTPTASGSRAGLFSVGTSLGTQTATLSGTGVAPATDKISPTSLSFASQTVGTLSKPQTVTLSNSGDSPLNSISVVAKGDFQVVDGCGKSLIGHARCAVSVVFSPKLVGAESGSLTLNDMYGNPQVVTLLGTGAAPAGISALPGAVDFGAWGIAGTSPQQTISITNHGGAPLEGLAATITSHFSIAMNSCPTSLAAGASCSVQVTFSPIGPGPVSGSLTIASTTLTAPLVITLSGIGLDFSMAPQGSSSVTVTSGKTASYQLQIVPATGSSGTLTFSCSSTPPNSSCTANPASLQLRPGVTGSVTVSITTVAITSASNSLNNRLLVAFAAFPVGLLTISRLCRRSRLLALLCIALLAPSGCGVTSSVGTGARSIGSGPGSTPPATYNPAVTATGPGITRSVQLTLVVE